METPKKQHLSGKNHGHHDSFKKTPPYFLRDSVAAQNGGGSRISMDFCRSIFAFFQVYLTVLKCHWCWSSYAEVVSCRPFAKVHRVCFFWSARVHLGSHENGEFFEFDFLTPKFQKVIAMAVPNGVIGRCSSLQKYMLSRNYIGYFFPTRNGDSFPCHIWSCQRLVLWPEKVWLGLYTGNETTI